MIEDEAVELTDAVLIDRAKRGDHQAFGTLYSRYVDAIFRYVRSRVDDQQTAEDLTEAVFLRSFEAIGRYREKGLKYSAYLYQVARNHLTDHYRRPVENVAIESIEHQIDSAQTVDSKIIHQEQGAKLRSALDRLPQEYQEIIRIRILLELSTTEAAQWMKRTEGATRVLLHRALKALKREVEEGDDAAI